MKRSIILMVVFLIAGSMVSAQKTTKVLEKFSKLKVFDQISVTLVKSASDKAVISGDDQDKVDIVNKNGELKVRMSMDKMMAGKHTDVILYYTQELEVIDVNEKAKILNKSTLNAKYLNLRAQEGGEIDVAVDTENLDSKAVTGGSIKVSGTAINQNIEINSGGNYDGRKLHGDKAKVAVLAGGGAAVKAKKMVSASVTAGGSIDIYGKPEKVDQNNALGGTITLH